MRQTIIAAAAAFVIGGAATGAVLSQAQPAPPPGQQMDAQQMDGHHMDGPPHHWMHWMHGMHRPPFAPRSLALVYPQADRQLAPADVQKIAEAFLLWNGNHSWKVTDVAPAADGAIGFSLATAQGSVVAKFTMDPHTGHITRVS
ncbi:MAG TPA: hypothetical protein PLD10_17490 [Rhodopila sp.]|nr:hypothetical protein [Rhodopila sp.]